MDDALPFLRTSQNHTRMSTDRSSHPSLPIYELLISLHGEQVGERVFLYRLYGQNIDEMF